ncbi:MAG: hypothetical protein R3D63_06735 [Paracoccaceae bacterium]
MPACPARIGPIRSGALRSTLARLATALCAQQRRALRVAALAFAAGVLLYLRHPGHVGALPVPLYTGLLYAGLITPAAVLTALFLPALTALSDAVQLSRLAFASAVAAFPGLLRPWPTSPWSAPPWSSGRQRPCRARPLSRDASLARSPRAGCPAPSGRPPAQGRITHPRQPVPPAAASARLQPGSGHQMPLSLAKALAAGLAFAALASPVAGQGRMDHLAQLFGALPGQVFQPALTTDARGYSVSFADPATASVALPDPTADDWPWPRLVLSSPYGYAAGADWLPRLGYARADLLALATADAGDRSIALHLLATDKTAAIGPALLASGYAAAPEGYWTRGADDSISLAARDPQDPFGRGIGKASRIAVAGDLVLQSSGTDTLLRMRAGTDTGHPYLAALLAAMDTAAPADLAVLNAMTLPDARLLSAGPAARPVPWRLGVLADLAAGDRTATVLALAFDSRGAADQAALWLADGWATTPQADALGALLTGADPTAAPTLRTAFAQEPQVAVTGAAPAILTLVLTGTADEDGRNAEYRALTGLMMTARLSLFGTAP